MSLYRVRQAFGPVCSTLTWSVFAGQYATFKISSVLEDNPTWPCVAYTFTPPLWTWRSLKVYVK